MCNTDDPVQLTAEPAGGSYSGDAVSDEGLFDPAIAEIGWNMVTYKYEDSISCVNSAYDSIFVDNCTGIGNRHFDDDSEVRSEEHTSNSSH